MKIKGKILDYGIEIIDAPATSLDGVPKAKVSFEVTEKINETNLEYSTISWDGLFLNKEGNINKNTAKCLWEMGFRGSDPIVLAEGVDGGSLDIDHEYFIELEKNEKGYWQVKFINREEFTGGVQIKKASKEALKAKFASMTNLKGNLQKAFSEFNKNKPDVPEFNSKDEIPF